MLLIQQYNTFIRHGKRKIRKDKPKHRQQDDLISLPDKVKTSQKKKYLRKDTYRQHGNLISLLPEIGVKRQKSHRQQGDLTSLITETGMGGG
jgi:hypothetical protein